MTAQFFHVLVAAAFALPAAYGQFELRAVVGGVEQPVGGVFEMGATYPGETLTAAFRLRNASATAEATVAHLDVAGDGFELAAPPRPITLQPRAAVDFTVRFKSTRTGAYSAPLVCDGISVFLVASVAPWLTYRVDSDAGFLPLSGAVDFGDVQSGKAGVRNFSVQNQMGVPLMIPALNVSGPGFLLTGRSPSGLVLQPSETTAFEVTFRAEYGVAAGVRAGSLLIGDRTYELRAAVVAPPPAKLRMSIDLPEPGSARQGMVMLTGEEALPYAIEGTLAVAFEASAAGAVDPAICFSNGDRTTRFTIAPGTTEARFSGQAGAVFQTGSTAGTLTFSATGGVSVEPRPVIIAPAAVGVTAARATRTWGGIEVVITGFDNTRTAGPMRFTLFDAAGNAVAPGSISVDASAAFASYFNTPSAGGAFNLKAVFPVTGDASKIAAFEAAIVNASGAAVTPRTSF